MAITSIGYGLFPTYDASTAVRVSGTGSAIVGDLGIMAAGSRVNLPGSPRTIGFPAGWTVLGDVDVVNGAGTLAIHLSVAWKILDAADIAAGVGVTWGAGFLGATNGPLRMQALNIFRGAFGPVGTVHSASSPGTGVITAGDPGVTAGGPWLVNWWAAAGSSGSATLPTGWANRNAYSYPSGAPRMIGGRQRLAVASPVMPASASALVHAAVVSFAISDIPLPPPSTGGGHRMVMNANTARG